jgi:hypothetical protein
MAVISWGKPKIVAQKDGENTYLLLPDGVENSTTLATTKGDKKEAKVEGGENEDVRYGKSTYALSVEIRAAKGRQKPFEDKDGLVDGEYKVWLQPEDAETPGLHIARARVSAELKYDAENGISWVYTFDALKPTDDVDQVQVGIVTIGSDNKPTFE